MNATVSKNEHQPWIDRRTSYITIGGGRGSAWDVVKAWVARVDVRMANPPLADSSLE